MNKLAAAALTVLLIAGCAKPAPDEPAHEAPVPPARQPTVDPKSSAAAEELVTGFARLLGTGRSDQAYMLLGPNAPPRKSFNSDFERIRNMQVNVGRAGDQEGAAGSIYLSVPLAISGTVDGKRVSRSAKVLVRRANDVPGSTEAQRHWHIERIDWEH